MGDWRKEYKDSIYISDGLAESLHRKMVDEISVMITDRDNMIINELEKVNGKSFGSEEEAVMFYKNRCRLVEHKGGEVETSVLYVDEKEWIAFNNVGGFACLYKDKNLHGNQS